MTLIFSFPILDTIWRPRVAKERMDFFMKKFWILALSAVMALSCLTGCGGDEEEYVDEAPVEEDIVEEEIVEEPAEEAADYIQVPVSLVNGTGVDIYDIRCSGSGLEQWGENAIPEGAYLPAGNYMDVVFTVDADNLVWDLYAEDQEGTSLSFYGLDISEMPADGFGIELLFENGEAYAALRTSADELEGEYSPA